MSKGMRNKAKRKAKAKTSPWHDFNTTYVYPGNPGSYDYTRPEAYRRKDERPGTTGLYKRDDRFGPILNVRTRASG